MNNKKGIALIMAVGILAILAVIAMSFALNMRLEYRAATNYYNSVKARYFAESALERAIAELRQHVRSSAFDDLSEQWASSGYSNDNLGANIISGQGTSVTSTIYDEQRKVNINVANERLLQNLCHYVRLANVSNNAITSLADPSGTLIYNYSNRPFSKKKELLKLSYFGTKDSAGEYPYYEVMQSYITTYSYVRIDADSGNSYSPVNINTADPIVLQSIFRAISSDDADDVPVNATISELDVPSIVTAIIQRRSSQPFTNWNDFNSVIDSISTLTPSQKTLIKYNCNPNRPKPTTYTTEFCFNSGGYYQIIARGRVTDFLNIPQADRTISAIVKIYDIYNETTKEQFELGSPVRVTWLDRCPVNSDDLFGSYDIPSDAETISDSIKLGYWDDFDEDLTYSNANWINTATNPVNSKYLISDYNTTADRNIHPDFSGSQPQYGKYTLSKSITGGGNSWTFNNFALRMREKDFGGTTLLRRAGQLIIGGSGEAALLEGKQNPLEWGGTYAWDIPIVDNNGDPTGSFKTNTDGSRYFEWVPNSQQMNYKGGTCWIYNYPTDQGPVINLTDAKFGNLHHIFDNQIRIWPNTNLTTGNPYSWYPGDNVIEYYATCTSYAAEKTFNVNRTGSTVNLSRFASTETVGPVTKNDCFSGDSLISLYCAEIFPFWDDIRIISPDGNFTSQTIDFSATYPSGVGWGTLVSTMTTPASATSAGATVAATFETSSDGRTTWQTVDAATNQITAASSSSIIYRATLTTDNNEETPVLEDITITYLPKVQIKSYSVSQ